MKKHIFGFVLFSFIVASFALVYTFFYAPSMPSREAVKPPVSRTENREEKPYSCQLRRNRISHEIISSQYFVDENKIVSKIRISLDRAASIPEKVYISATFASASNIGKEGFGDYQVFENPFAESREKVVTVVSKLSDKDIIKKNENLYVMALVTDYDSSIDNNKSKDVTPAEPVLFIYGKSSVKKPTVIIRDTSIPR